MLKSKLIEKDVRMPSPHEAFIKRIISKYLSDIRTTPSEPGKVARFSTLLHDLFQSDSLDFSPLSEFAKSMETPVRFEREGIIVRGRVDALYGNVLFEFERNLEVAKLREAERQLLEYLPSVNRSRGSDFVGIATDGQTFRAYSLGAEDSGEARLALIETINASDLDPMEFYYWLDRYLLRSRPVEPTSENFLKDFGPRSHVHQTLSSILREAYEQHSTDERVKVLFEQWDKYLRVAYGSAVAAPELFLRHTYLATLAKLLAWIHVEEGASSDAPVKKILEGSYFRDQNIYNFLEEDFFSWLAIPSPTIEDARGRVAEGFLSILNLYNLKGLSEDVLKGLYQGLVDPKDRHDLGEYYTPDWLADAIVQKVLAEKPKAKVLDPACGSGTFLYAAIKYKKKKSPESQRSLLEIVNSIFGIDIHPLAVIIAKTNYILALGSLLHKRGSKRIDLPIYLANSIVLSEEKLKQSLFNNVECYKIEISGSKDIGIPQTFIDDEKSRWLFDAAVETANAYAHDRSGKGADRQYFGKLLGKIENAVIVPDQQQVLFALAEAMRRAVDSNRDTIWAYIIKNSLRPVMLQRSFDALIGNPPWLTLKDISEREYQDKVRALFGQHTATRADSASAKPDHKLQAHLITHLELATLFWVHAPNLYLKRTGGRVAFVMPRSVFNSDHHDRIRTGTYANSAIRVSELWDMNASTRESVSPMFNVPSCVLFGNFSPGEPPRQEFPIPTTILSGKLKLHNATLRGDSSAFFDTSGGEIAKRSSEVFLAKSDGSSAWNETEQKAGIRSPYFKDFFEGATLVPRTLWFVQPVVTGTGIDTGRPRVRTDFRAIAEAKKPYNLLSSSGVVEKEYLFGTLLSTDLVPFGHLPLRMVVMPAKFVGNKLKMITEAEARKEAKTGVADWLRDAEIKWEANKTAKNKLTAYERLNYNRGIVQQNMRTKYRVLYPMSGSRLCATMLGPSDLEVMVGQQSIRLSAFVVDYKCYYFETSNEREALYLTAVLNSSFLEGLIQPFVTRGFGGAARDIVKLPFHFPIPRFDEARKEHLNLSELARESSLLSQSFLGLTPAPNPIRPSLIGKYRNRIRAAISDQLEEIDGLVRKLLS